MLRCKLVLLYDIVRELAEFDLPMVFVQYIEKLLSSENTNEKISTGRSGLF